MRAVSLRARKWKESRRQMTSEIHGIYGRHGAGTGMPEPSVLRPPLSACNLQRGEGLDYGGSEGSLGVMTHGRPGNVTQVHLSDKPVMNHILRKEWLLFRLKHIIIHLCDQPPYPTGISQPSLVLSARWEAMEAIRRVSRVQGQVTGVSTSVSRIRTWMNDGLCLPTCSP